MSVLVIDDLLLRPLTPDQGADLLEVIEDRAGLRATIITSQLPVAMWHQAIADPTIADAALDRILGSAERIELTGESMRRARPPGPRRPHPGSSHDPRPGPGRHPNPRRALITPARSSAPASTSPPWTPPCSPKRHASPAATWPRTTGSAARAAAARPLRPAGDA